MDLTPLLGLCLAILCIGLLLRYLLGLRVVRVIRDQDYADGRARTYQRVRLQTDRSSAGTYLADAQTGRPLQFVGCRAVKVQTQFRAADRSANVAILLEGVPISFQTENHDAAEGR